MTKTRSQLKEEAARILKDLDGKELKPKDRIAIPPQEMPAQDPAVRVKNMEEVALLERIFKSKT